MTTSMITCVPTLSPTREVLAAGAVKFFGEAAFFEKLPVQLPELLVEQGNDRDPSTSSG
jgi:hypothetical protein